MLYLVQLPGSGNPTTYTALKTYLHRVLYNNPNETWEKPHKNANDHFKGETEFNADNKAASRALHKTKTIL